MPSNFPGGLDSFTTKVDGIDDIMADHVNDLQNSVVAVETLLLAKLTGWVNWPTQPVYVSATSIRFNSIDLTTLFPVGTKIRLTQTTEKYFYVLAAAYSGGNTTLTLYAGNMFSVTNAAITGFGFSHGLADGFLEWFDWTPNVSGSGSMTVSDLVITTSRFNIIGKQLNFYVRITVTLGGTPSSTINIEYPVATIASSFNVSHSAAVTPVTSAFIVGIGVNTSSTYMGIRVNDGSNWTLGSNKNIICTGFIEI